MASIVGKGSGEQTYYYLRELARVGGKPKIVSQRYLGKASDIEAGSEAAPGDAGPHPPSRLRGPGRGVVGAASAWGGRHRRRGRRARRADAAASVGTYIALAAAQPGRASRAPSSPFADWWATTAADRWVRVPPRRWITAGSGTRWTPSTTDALIEIERRLVDAMVDEFGLDLSGLVLDMTNFATYIDSANDRAAIAQRGHAKQKRTDLAPRRPRPGGVHRRWDPDLSRHAYPGNKPDVTQFADIVTELVTRCWEHSGRSRRRAHLGL